MAYIGMAYIPMACTVMAYTFMAYTIMAYIFIAYINMGTLEILGAVLESGSANNDPCQPAVICLCSLQRLVYSQSCAHLCPRISEVCRCARPK